jgi:UDP-2,3-diacylglucosamine pyrophosphatase LpxH
MSADSNTTRIIISDLHIGRNDKFDIFQGPEKTDAFEKFLASCGTRTEPVELVINGDFVDFLQLKPWNVHESKDLAQTRILKEVALTKIQEIVSGNSAVFTALGKFLAQPDHYISILLGNHDVELAYREVSAVVRHKILGVTPDASQRLVFNDRARQYNFPVNGVRVHIEHGNEGDPWNTIPYTQLFENADKNSGFAYPAGTRFVYDVMNQFKDKFQFVDLLKPEVPAVPLLLARLGGLRAIADSLPKASRTFLLSIRDGFLGMLRRAIGGGSFARAGASLTDDERLYAGMAQAYIEQVSGADKTKFGRLDVEHLAEFLSQSELQTGEAASPSLGRRWDAVKNYFVTAILSTLGRPRVQDDRAFFAQDHSGRDAESAEKEFKGDVQVVVFGHTHSALKKEFARDRVYINSGTWANLIGLPSDPRQFTDWLQLLANNGFERTSFPTYVTIEPAGSGLAASLNHWDGNGEVQLWKRTISVSK